MRGLIQSYADRQAELRPKAAAIVLDNHSLSYRELSEWSNALARALQSQGCMRGDRVGLVVSKTPLAIASILGVLKAGCIYVPIDIESPAERAIRILESSDPRLLLADTPGQKLLSQIHSSLPFASIDPGTAASVPVVWGHPGLSPVFGPQHIATFSKAPVPCPSQPNDPAYILYTSGSTGVPKGVVITHGNVREFIEWAIPYFHLTASDRISGHPPLHFDLSVFDIFGAFASGAELHLVPALLNLSAPSMAGFIRRSRLTQWFSVPAAMNYMAKFDTIRPNDFPDLKRVLWCGEVLPTPTLRYWMERLPAVQFTNLYGPTEATIASSYYTIPSLPQPDQAIPIGTPCGGEQLWVLDGQLREVPPHTTGDLYIAGMGLSPGYWRDPDKTRTAFLQSPSGHGRIYKTGDLARTGPDGLVYFAGRADSQIKSRGYRIELGEIEVALNGISDLKESAVVAISTTEFEGSMICCAFSPVAGARVTPVGLKEILQNKLPRYMMPSRWMDLDGLPKNANGKIDRPLLRELFVQRGTHL